MATQDLYAEWEQRTVAKGLQKGRKEGRKEGRQEGRQEGLVVSLSGTYEQRFGEMPVALVERLHEVVDAESIGRWVLLFVSASAEEIAAAVRDGRPEP